MAKPEEATAVAIECLTLWMESGKQEREIAAAHITDLQEDPAVGPTTIIAGLLNLGMFLANKAAKEAGAHTPDEYGRLTKSYLEEFGLGLAQRDH